MIWNPCNQSLPGDRSMVLIFNEGWLGEETWVGFHDGKQWISAEGLWLASSPESGESDAAPMHWMPLPAPPVDGWSPELQALSHLRPELVCTSFKYGRVQLASGEQLVTVCLCRTANAAPLASAVLSIDEAVDVSGELARVAIKARAKAPQGKEEQP